MGGKDLILRQSADPSGTATNGAQLALRDTASVAADGACVAAVVRLGELAGRSKVQCGESGRLPEKMGAGKSGELLKGIHQWRVNGYIELIWSALTGRALRPSPNPIRVGVWWREVHGIEKREGIIRELGRVGESVEILWRRHGLPGRANAATGAATRVS